jgi:ABC-2 type transport system permease protein
VRRFADVALAVAWRSLHNWLTEPSFFLPSLAFPLFFFTAFAGGLSSVGEAPGFDFPSGYTAFQFVFVLLQASAFGGVFTALGIAADFERGFARRFMLAAPNRLAILVGYLLVALSRATIVGALLFAIALATGMQVGGGPVDVGGLVLLGYLMSLIATLFTAGVAFRARTVQAGPAMQIPVFVLLFLAPVFVPLELLSGWVEWAARVNPFTPIVETGRDFIAGLEAPTGLAYGIAAALVAVFAVWAVRGLRRAEAAGG